MLTRRDFVAGSAASGAVSAATPKRPNILFVMVDEMRWDAMGCEKHPVVQTPNLDRFAREGVRFSSSYTVSPVCSPARASVFTGRYQHVHGVTTNGIPAAAGEIFLPSVLKHGGYHTAIAGKLHYTPTRFAYGFDQFWSFSSEGPTPETGYNAFLRNKHGSPSKWPIVPGTCPWPDDPLGRDVGLFKHPKEDFETEWLTDRSVDYLRSRKNKSEPWFLFTSYLKPHSPSVEPEPYFSMYDPRAMPVPKLPPNAAAIRAAQRGQSRRHYVDNEEMMRVMSAKYYGAITHIDHQFGRLLGELERLGMANDTVVLFTADHGNMLGDRGRWFKGLQYDGSARVPLIWRGPVGSRQRGGRVVGKVIENTDLMPTILEAAGLPVPDGVQGRSFLALAATGRDDRWKDRCFSQLRSGMLLENGYKLIDNSLDGTGTRELYDLRNDPREQHDLAASPAHRDRVTAMSSQIAEWRSARPAPARVPGMSTPDYAAISNAERQNAVENAPAVRDAAGAEAGKGGGRKKRI
jgi:arylsulfatase A-like enzyme